MKKVALITGASTGLGFHLALLLAKEGYITYATMRDLEKSSALLESAKASGLDLYVRQLDVQDTASVDRCIADIVEQHQHIDVLINNAGAGFVRTTEQATEEEIQWVLDVNFTGVVRCTKAVLPHMRQQRSGHIVNISSIGGLVGQPFNEIYCAAKFAVEGYTESLASYVQPAFNIHFTAVEPGGIRSDFTKNVFTQFADGGGFRDDDYKPLLEKYIANAQARAAESDSGVYQTSEEVAEVVATCIAMESPPVRMRTSDWSEAFCRLKTDLDPDGKKVQAIISAMI